MLYLDMDRVSLLSVPIYLSISNIYVFFQSFSNQNEQVKIKSRRTGTRWTLGSSWDRGPALTFSLGCHEVTPGSFFIIESEAVLIAPRIVHSKQSSYSCDT